MRRCIVRGCIVRRCIVRRFVSGERCQEGFKEFVGGVVRVVRNFQERCQESCDESLKLEVSGKLISCQEQEVYC